MIDSEMFLREKQLLERGSVPIILKHGTLAIYGV